MSCCRSPGFDCCTLLFAHRPRVETVVAPRPCFALSSICAVAVADVEYWSCSPQLDSEVVASLHGQDSIAEDAEAEGATPILEEADMALALKEKTFVTRLIRQNSMQQRR